MERSEAVRVRSVDLGRGDVEESGQDDHLTVSRGHVVRSPAPPVGLLRTVPGQSLDTLLLPGHHRPDHGRPTSQVQRLLVTAVLQQQLHALLVAEVGGQHEGGGGEAGVGSVDHTGLLGVVQESLEGVVMALSGGAVDRSEATAGVVTGHQSALLLNTVKTEPRTLMRRLRTHQQQHHTVGPAGVAGKVERTPAEAVTEVDITEPRDEDQESVSVAVEGGQV